MIISKTSFRNKQVMAQHAKKVSCDSLGLVDFAIGLLIFVLNGQVPMGKCCFLGKFKLQKDCNQSC